MKKKIIACATMLVMNAAWAVQMGTPDEAKALSEKAQATVNEMGQEKAFALFAAEDSGFRNKDLYVFCMDMQGTMLSHPVKPELVGQNLLGFNKYGDELFKNMIGVAGDNGSGWVDYSWPYPGTEDIKQKTSYVMKNDAGFFCGVGAYK
ncbi:cache domain-containing protein [Thiosocius teredinicola]|uniref:cache domain-containing protein n=1 Tax=Thiosocius teredinicola TaxID=1973002 RepID=UPI000990B69E